ncbi:hypothetical protein FA95DRAFT_1675697 [Auriscalpium vulgare]|uniref:Uncharacterized protein n=1 Tax=Auriscalpium vulgare TaxID=40419 RepID=A0ACB8S598_9AGAM|nr:hypothetical protein FA95DRAFT_1675697 [Auriscalpium vulgare]
MASPEDGEQLTAARHRSGGSLLTTASGIAASTISFNTYATGITEDSLRLSQFPPPPTTIPSSPTDGVPSPTRSTFTITSAPGFVSPSSYKPVSPLVPRRQNSESSTATAQTPSAPSSFRPHLSPAYTPLSARNVPTPPSSPHSTSRSAPSSHPSRTLSPYDWHEGSSSIAVDPTEERLLSTSFITDLLTSTGSPRTTEAMGGIYSVRDGQHMYQGDSSSLISEMTYPPTRVPPSSPPAFRQDVMAGPSRPGPSSYAAGRSTYDNDTISSYESDARIVQGLHGLGRKVSVLGMAPATLRHMASEDTSISDSPMTLSSTVPLAPNRRVLSGGAYEVAVPEEVASAGLQVGSSTQMLFSPAAPSSAGFRPSYQQSGTSFTRERERRASTQSNKTVKSHVSSFVSAVGQRSLRAARQTFDWLRVKPLPPVPTIPNMSYLQEQEYRRMESDVPLPDLAERAHRLGAMLDSGRLPHESVGSFSVIGNAIEKASPKLSGRTHANASHATGLHKPAGGRKRQSLTAIPSAENGLGSPSKARFKALSCFNIPLTKKQKIQLSVAAAVFALLTVIAVVVGIVVGHKHGHGISCPANFTGAACSLSATCVCTSSDSSQCNPLAQSLITLVPTVNTLFNANYTPSSVAAAMFAVQGTSLGSDCAAQARIVDVAPALDMQTTPNRTQWAQSALLWTFVQSLDPTNVGNLQQYIHKAQWSVFDGVDGPVPAESSSFTTTVLGFTFDFANQVLSEPAASFETDGQPSSAQSAQVSKTASAALDRMYTYAAASSTLRQSALANYWQSALRQNPSDLSKFVSLFASSPLLLPFDATGSPGKVPLSSLLTNSSTASFPPPLSCYPGLGSTQLQQVNALETSIFGLTAASPQTSFDSSCYADRPIYGQLDILHLREPFLDSVSNAPKQAAVLNLAVRPRVIAYKAGALSLLPNATPLALPPSNPLQYGTLNHINHVLYDFLTSIPDINVATAFVKYILSSPVAPPASGTQLAQAMGSIPAIEVAVFGSVAGDDVDSVVSSFGTPTGNLFFGSDQSLALRNWAINGTQSSIAWADSASAATVVHDTSFSDAVFNSVWSPAFTFFHSQTNQVVNVGNITTAFQVLGKFTP